MDTRAVLTIMAIAICMVAADAAADTEPYYLRFVEPYYRHVSERTRQECLRLDRIAARAIDLRQRGLAKRYIDSDLRKDMSELNGVEFRRMQQVLQEVMDISVTSGHEARTFLLDHRCGGRYR